MNSFVGDEDIKDKTESSTTHQQIFDFKWTVRNNKIYYASNFLIKFINFLLNA